MSEKTSETSTLAIVRNGESIVINHVDSELPLSMGGQVGQYWPLHASASGKVHLCWVPGMREALPRSLKRFTPTTITDATKLDVELNRARAQGYASVRGEFYEDVWAVAAPIWNHRNEIEAAITVGGPSSRVTIPHLAMLGRAAMKEGLTLSRALGYAGAYPPPMKDLCPRGVDRTIQVATRGIVAGVTHSAVEPFAESLATAASAGIGAWISGQVGALAIEDNTTTVLTVIFATAVVATVVLVALRRGLGRLTI